MVYEIINVIELAFPPVPQLHTYVPVVAPKVANVVELNVVVPLINELDNNTNINRNSYSPFC
jgi:hypothetical protein